MQITRKMGEDIMALPHEKKVGRTYKSLVGQFLVKGDRVYSFLHGANSTSLNANRMNEEEIPDGLYSFDDLKTRIQLTKTLKTDVIDLPAPTEVKEGQEAPYLPSPLAKNIVYLPFSLKNTSWKEIMAYASDDEARYFMNGVFLDPQGQIVATDGRRMLINEGSITAWKKPEAFLTDVILPLDFVSILPEEGTIFLFMADNMVKIYAFISHGGIDYTINTIEGRYPNWRRVVPKNGKQKVRFPAEEIEKAAILTKKGRRASHKAIFKSGIFQEGFEQKEDSVVTEDTCAFNATYMADVKKYSPKGTVEFLFRTEGMTKAFLHERGGTTIIIMPMQMN